MALASHTDCCPYSVYRVVSASRWTPIFEPAMSSALHPCGRLAGDLGRKVTQPESSRPVAAYGVERHGVGSVHCRTLSIAQSAPFIRSAIFSSETHW